MEVKIVIERFDRHLESKGMTFSGVVIGGAALNLLGVVDRATSDVDCLRPELSKELLEVAEEFRARNPDLELKENWFNNGPISLQRDLPEGWFKRCVPLFQGSALTLSTLGREDLLRSKLLAYCDRGDDLKDCIKLNPTRKEIQGVQGWIEQYDGNPDWPEHVRRQLSILSKRLNHDKEPDFEF